MDKKIRKYSLLIIASKDVTIIRVELTNPLNILMKFERRNP